MDAEAKLQKVREIASLWNWSQYGYPGGSDDAMEDILAVVGDWRQEGTEEKTDAAHTLSAQI